MYTLGGKGNVDMRQEDELRVWRKLKLTETGAGVGLAGLFEVMVIDG